MADKKKLLEICKLKIVHHKKMAIITGALVIVLVAAVVIAGSADDGNGETVYRETTVQQGTLTVGIEASGSVEIGTVDQTFELDLSEYVSTTSSSSGISNSALGMGGSGNGGGGGNMFSQMIALATGMGNGNTSSNTSSMEISEVCVTAGQQVLEGDILYKLTDDSVSEIRDQLETDVDSAKADLDLILADNTVSKVSAASTLDLAKAYGTYASTEYNAAIAALEKAAADLQEQITLFEEELTANQQKLTEKQSEYAMVQETADAFKWSVDNMDAEEDLANYISFENSRESAQSNADSLKSDVEQLEETIKQAQKDLINLRRELAQANRELASGRLSAKQTYDLRVLTNSTAQETYDVSVGYLDVNYKEQNDIYEDAKEKLDEFDTNISDNTVISEHSGTITEVPLTEGDTITTNTTLLSLYDEEETTITVSLADDDVDSIEEGGMVNIYFTAYPDDIFQGIISDIEDAETDSDGDTTYPVEVTIQGDVSGLFEGMTGDLTFITKQTEEVVYVSNRAIFRDGTKSYVKMKDENGKIVEKNVTTGFSDGENVEIIEGLSKGDVVLIESKVNGG